MQFRFRCYRTPDLHGPLSNDATWRAETVAGDGAHPNAGGYARAAALVEAWEPWRAWTMASEHPLHEGGRKEWA